MIKNTSSIRTRVSAPLRLAAATLLGIFFVFARWYSNYSPHWDDPAVLGASAESPIHWFTLGYSQYFLAFPEWNQPLWNFLRPGANAIVRLDQLLFRTHYAFYFLLYYLGQFLLIWIVVLLARELGVREKWLLLLAFLLAIEPAFFSTGLIQISDQFDVWCGLFTVAAFFFLTRRQYVLALISLMLAVFTKESALYAPVAAAFTVAYGTRRKVLASTMLLPLAAWVAARRFLFIAPGLKGVYAVSGSPKEFVLNAVKGMLYWPNGLLQDVTHTSLADDLLHSLRTPIFLLANVFLWILLLAIGIKLIRRDKADLLSPLTVFVWLSGALSFGVLVAHEPRFGGSIYPLELLLLAVASSALPISRLRTGSLVALCLMAPAFLWNMFSLVPRMDDHRREQDAMMRLTDALKHIGNNVDTIYILNSADSYSAPEYLARLAGISGHIVVLNQFKGCLTDSLGSTALSQIGASEMKIAAQLPPCADLVFEGLVPATFAPAVGGAMMRDDFARYTLPEARVVGHGVFVNPRFLQINLGRQLNITLEGFDPQSSALLYYDWGTGQYRCVGIQCAAP